LSRTNPIHGSANNITITHVRLYQNRLELVKVGTGVYVVGWKREKKEYPYLTGISSTFGISLLGNKPLWESV